MDRRGEGLLALEQDALRRLAELDGRVVVLGQVARRHVLVAAGGIEHHHVGLVHLVLPHQLLGPREIAIGVHPLHAQHRRGILVFLQEIADVLVHLVARLEEDDRVDPVREAGQQAQGLVRQAVVARPAPIQADVMPVGQVVDHEDQKGGEPQRDQRVDADRELPPSPALHRAAVVMTAVHRYFHFLDSITLMVVNSISALTDSARTIGRESTAPREKSSMWEIDEM